MNDHGGEVLGVALHVEGVFRGHALEERAGGVPAGGAGGVHARARMDQGDAVVRLEQIAAAHLTHFKAVLSDASKGRYDRDKAVQIREAARLSVGSNMPAKALELQHTIRLIRELDKEIAEIEAAIKTIIDEMAPPILTIPGISYRMGAMILAEIGDFSRFDSPDKLLAYAGLSPSTY